MVQSTNAKDKVDKLLKLKERIEKFEVKPLSRDEQENFLLERLKKLYLEKNPYGTPPAGVFGSPASNWNFDKHDTMKNIIRTLNERGRQDLINKFEEFKAEQTKKEEDEKLKKISEYLLENGIDLSKIENEILKNYIIFTEKRLKKY